MYRAFVTRASSGDIDNSPIIERILMLRKEKAQLLGFASFAELSMASKARPQFSSLSFHHSVIQAVLACLRSYVKLVIQTCVSLAFGLNGVSSIMSLIFYGPV